MISSRVVGLIVTDSCYSKEEIVHFLKIRSAKVVPIHLGLDHFAYDTPEISKKGDYIFYFGAIERTKGVEQAVNAYLDIEEFAIDNVKMIIAGKKGNAWGDIESKVSNERIVYLGEVPDSELLKWISEAKLVIFPSLYEGFGFPALEACMLNENVLTSSTTSLGEIAGNFATLANPSDHEALREGIRMAYDKERGTDMFSRRGKILSKFSWRKHAVLLMNIYSKSVALD